MRHPKISDWTDFVRAVAADGDRAVMQRHLDQGCRDCEATVRALRQVAETVAAELALEPAAGAVRLVKAFFATQHPQAHGSWTELELRRVFDSTLAPAPAAFRAQGDGQRQLLFESDEYTVELSFEHSPGEVDAVLRGQILAAHGEPRSHAPVFLVGDGEVISRAISAQHGTFEMSGRLDQPCELWVFPDDHNRIRLRLEPDN